MPATKTPPKPQKTVREKTAPSQPKAPPQAAPTVKRELTLFTDLLEAVRATDRETSMLMEGEEAWGTIRLYELLSLYCEGEWEQEATQRQEDREALHATLDPTTYRHLQVVHSNQAVLRFYTWLAEHGFVSRKDYEQVLALAKGTINAVLA